MTPRDVNLVDEVTDAAFASDRSGLVVAWNAAAERLLGIPASRAIGTRCADMLRGRSRTGVPVCTTPCPLLECLPGGSPDCLQASLPEVRPAHPDLTIERAGSGVVDVRVVAVPIAGDHGSVLLHVLRRCDDAALDPLTGCLRPWSFTPRAVALQDYAVRFSQPLAAAVVTVDDLASIARDHGRGMGDRAIAAVGLYLRYGRRDDAVGRSGGGEFALVLPAMTAAQAANRLRRTLGTVRANARVGDHPVTFSAGVVDLDPLTPVSRALHRAAVLLDPAGPPGRILTA